MGVVITSTKRLSGHSLIKLVVKSMVTVNPASTYKIQLNLTTFNTAHNQAVKIKLK